MFALQTSVASAAATNDPAIFAIALFVIAGGIAFGLLLGLPWIYVVAAAALFGIASGYVGTVVTFLVFVTLVRRNAVTIWAWLERHAEGADGNGRAGRFAAWGQRFRDRRRYGSRTRGEGRGKRSTRFGRKAQGSHQHGGHAGFGSGTHSGDGAYSGAAPYQAATRPAPEAVLGLAPGFNRRDLDKARRRLAKEFHPDRHQRAPAATQASMAEKMRAVNDAYEELKERVAA